MKYRQETLTEVQDEIKPLLEKHWEEIALNQEKVKLNPSWQTYKALEDSGCLYIFTARTDEGKLVGYYVSIVSPSLHYSDHKFAINDIIFIHPDYRKGLCGAKLIKYGEKKFREDGVSVVFINTKVHKPFDPLLERLGFKNIERLYSKYIGE